MPFHCPNNRYVNDEETCLAVVSMWAKLDIKARLIAAPWSQHTQTYQRGEAALYLLGWGVATFDGQYTLQDIIRTRTSGPDGHSNFSKVSDAKIDQLVDAMKVETDVAKRNAQIREALVRVRDEVFFIPLHHQMRPWAMRANVDAPHRANDNPQSWRTTVR